MGRGVVGALAFLPPPVFSILFVQGALSVFFAPALRQVELAKRNGESPGAANSDSASSASPESRSRENHVGLGRR